MRRIATTGARPIIALMYILLDRVGSTLLVSNSIFSLSMSKKQIYAGWTIAFMINLWRHQIVTLSSSPELALHLLHIVVDGLTHNLVLMPHDNGETLNGDMKFL